MLEKMKKALLILAAVLVSLSAVAIPVKPGQWRTLTLADGTTVRAEAHGSITFDYDPGATGIGGIEASANL